MPVYRVSSSQVLAIMDTSLSASEINPFIITANQIINSTAVGKGYTEDELTQLELYLAAHLCALKDPLPESEKIDAVSVKYQGRTGKGLEATQYGQTVLLMDYRGALRDSLTRQAAGLWAVPESEEGA